MPNEHPNKLILNVQQELNMNYFELFDYFVLVLNVSADN